MDKISRAEWKLSGTCLKCGSDTIWGNYRANRDGIAGQLQKKYCEEHYYEELHKAMAKSIGVNPFG